MDFGLLSFAPICSYDQLSGSLGSEIPTMINNNNLINKRFKRKNRESIFFFFTVHQMKLPNEKIGHKLPSNYNIEPSKKLKKLPKSQNHAKTEVNEERSTHLGIKKNYAFLDL